MLSNVEEGEGEVFSTILNLEDHYHAEGYALGVSDGAKSGRTEGRIFGLEKGFEKFIELGRLHGRADVWQHDDRVRSNERLKRHVERLASLTSPEGLSTENSEDAVNETEDRIRDAKGKERMIRRSLAEEESALQKAGGINVESGELGGTGYRSANPSQKKSTTRAELEDFEGLPHQRVAS